MRDCLQVYHLRMEVIVSHFPRKAGPMKKGCHQDAWSSEIEAQ